MLIDKFKKIIQESFSLFKRDKSVILTLLAVGILVDIVLIDGVYDVGIFSILGLSIFSVIIYKLSSRVVFSICLSLLGIIIFSFSSGISSITEKAAVWWFLFLPVGIFRQWEELSIEKNINHKHSNIMNLILINKISLSIYSTYRRLHDIIYKIKKHV